MENDIKIHRLVLTGGPCSGKTTGQLKIVEFFEERGWKVFRVQESAGILIGGGISFYDLTPTQVEQFEEDCIKTMMTLEEAFYKLSQLWTKSCLIICDRGCMDCSAYSPNDMWNRILSKCNWNNVHLRDNRYDQVIHVVSAADGAEMFYAKSEIRTEEPELARKLDFWTSQAWIGHPQMDIIDNSTDFETKLNRIITCICKEVGMEFDDKHKIKKFRYLIESMPKDEEFGRFEEFQVQYDFLKTNQKHIKQLIKKRGQNGNWSYRLLTLNNKNGNNGCDKIKRILSNDEYLNLITGIDSTKRAVALRERCFIWKNSYFKIFIYKEIFDGMIILESETSQYGSIHLPPYLIVKKDLDEHFLHPFEI